MKLAKRQIRAKRRAKTMRLRRMGVPCTQSKFGYSPTIDAWYYRWVPA